MEVLGKSMEEAFNGILKVANCSWQRCISLTSCVFLSDPELMLAGYNTVNKLFGQLHHHLRMLSKLHSTIILN